MSFRLGKWSNLAEDIKRVKGQDEGENDLHLEYPGIWAATLYPEIFGVPEMWLFLVSLIIRLSTERDVAEKEGVPATLSAKDFLSRAKAIERCINQMRKPPPNLDHYDDPAVDNMLDAMQNALIIYFYRKIYDVESTMLQHKVEMVRDCLLRCNPSDPDAVYGSARLLWPVLIAASEARDPDVQASFAAWLRAAAQRSGLRLFSDTLENLENVWQERRNFCDDIDPLIHPVLDPALPIHCS
ncbi:hypothetical protein N0V90_003983 [Kalmusia sp. IMI 367209]|nr:hypothetical protein N0V90_003983 [Kalmusia sp. IMI 367209]